MPKKENQLASYHNMRDKIDERIAAYAEAISALPKGHLIAISREDLVVILTKMGLFGPAAKLEEKTTAETAIKRVFVQNRIPLVK